jgi:hypothetical protein
MEDDLMADAMSEIFGPVANENDLREVERTVSERQMG